MLDSMEAAPFAWDKGFSVTRLIEQVEPMDAKSLRGADIHEMTYDCVECTFSFHAAQTLIVPIGTDRTLGN
jgi:hypothetical protein